MASDYEVIIVGAGLSGLACAAELHALGKTFLLLEAADDVGGRVRTDRVDGFLLDRGFQVLLTSYAEVRRAIHGKEKQLDLKKFYPGALTWTGDGFRRVADPRRRPWGALKSCFKPVCGPVDAWRAWRFVRQLVAAKDGLPPPGRLFSKQSTASALDSFGISELLQQRFFRPFLGGVFLDPQLTTCASMMEFVLKKFALGDAAVPARGMQQFPRFLAGKLPADSIRLNCRAQSVVPGAVELTTGERLTAKNIVVATEAGVARNWFPQIPHATWRSTACVYFAAPEPPLSEPILLLNGAGRHRVVNHAAVVSNAAPAYAPQGQALISANVVRADAIHDPALAERVQAEMREWFGAQVDKWRHLKTYVVPHALPGLLSHQIDERMMQVDPPDLAYTQWKAGGKQFPQGICWIGDYMATPSIDGAMMAGRSAASAI